MYLWDHSAVHCDSHNAVVPRRAWLNFITAEAVAVLVAAEVRETVKPYRAESESKNLNSRSIRKLHRALGNITRVGLETLIRLESMHEQWRSSVMNGETPSDIAFDHTVWESYAEWLAITGRLVKDNDEFSEYCGKSVLKAEVLKNKYELLRIEMEHLSRPETPLGPVSEDDIQVITERCS
jgi:hypothetical protein